MKDIRFAILSYEYMKPVSPDIHTVLAEWVRCGGTLIYAGDGSDPFHAISSWWRDAGYENPAQHLFETLGLGRSPEEGEYAFGKGRVVVCCLLPARLSLKKADADAWRKVVRDTLRRGGVEWTWRNDITLRRGPYIICEVMDESVTDRPKTFEGRFVDLMADGFPVITGKTVRPDEGALLYDLDTLGAQDFAILGTCARLWDVEISGDALSFRAKAADQVLVQIRLHLPFLLKDVSAADEDGQAVDVACAMDEKTGTALLTYRSVDRAVTIRGRRAD